jgi:hypothetical protein
MKVKELIHLLEGLTEADKESPLLAQVWDPQNGVVDQYFEITSLSIVYQMVEYSKDGTTARSVPPTVILVHNPNVNNPDSAPNGAAAENGTIGDGPEGEVQGKS